MRTKAVIRALSLLVMVAILAAPAAAGAQEPQYYVYQGGQTLGPFPLSQLVQRPDFTLQTLVAPPLSWPEWERCWWSSRSSSMLYISACLMFIATKTNTESAWLAWVPVRNLFLMA